MKFICVSLAILLGLLSCKQTPAPHGNTSTFTGNYEDNGHLFLVTIVTHKDLINQIIAEAELSHIYNKLQFDYDESQKLKSVTRYSRSFRDKQPGHKPTSVELDTVTVNYIVQNEQVTSKSDLLLSDQISQIDLSLLVKKIIHDFRSHPNHYKEK